MNAKRVVRGILSKMPDDCTLEDVQYHLYVRQAVERGMQEIREGKGIPHKQVARELRRKWRKLAAK